jgi:hypothetical protein
MAPTKEQTRAAFTMIAGVAEAIREAGSIPSGVLYATLSGMTDIHGYERLIGMLKRSGLVEERHHELIWTGPMISE